MNDVLKNSIRFVLFLLIQVFVLNRVPPLHQFIVPYIYFIFLLWLPYRIHPFLLLLLSFFYGLALDYFSHSPGLHAAPCLLIGYLRPLALKLLIQQETAEQAYFEPSINSMGFTAYIIYVVFFTFIHHFLLVLIEWLQFGSFLYFLGKVGATTGISLLLIAVAELLFHFKKKAA